MKRIQLGKALFHSLVWAVYCLGSCLWGQDPAPIPIASLERSEPVDFSKEVYPILKKNCIACHSSSTSKGKLNLESPQSILKGGNDGPAIDPGNPEESFLLLVASHQEDPIMPPEKNKANAVPLTSEELGLLAQWIAEGGKGKAVVAAPTPTKWLLAERLDHPVYHMAMGHHDRYVAASRGQRVFLYDLERSQAMGELIDEQLATHPGFDARPPAHQDFVQSLAFSPDGWLATGGFRNVKLWRPHARGFQQARQLGAEVTALSASRDGRWVVSGDVGGGLQVWASERLGDAPLASFSDHQGAVHAVAFSGDGQWLVSGGDDGRVRLHRTSDWALEREWSAGEPLRSAAVLTESEQVVAGTASGDVWRWSLKADEEGSTLKGWKAHEGAVIGLLPIGQEAGEAQVATASVDGAVRLWKLAGAQEGASEVRKMDHGAPVLDLALSPDGQHLVSLSSEVAKVWKPAEGKLVSEVETNPSASEESRRLERKVEVSKVLVENRKKRSAEKQKARDDEMNKAKEAATSAQQALARIQGATRAEHEARLQMEEAIARVEAGKLEQAAKKAQLDGLLAKGEARVAEWEPRLAEENEAQQAPVAALEARVAALDALEKRSREEKEGWEGTIEEHRLVAVRDRLAQSLDHLREVASDLEGLAGQEASEMNAHLALAETLFARAEKRLREAEAGAAKASAAATLAARTSQLFRETIAERRQPALALEKALAVAREDVEEAKRGLQALEEESKALAEEQKQFEEKQKQVAAALEVSTKAHQQAVENDQLALRLSQRASEAHTRALMAQAAAEHRLGQDQNALEAHQKAESAALKLRAVAYLPSGESFAIANESGGILTYSADGSLALDRLAGVAGHALAGMVGGEWAVARADKALGTWRPGPEWRIARRLGMIEDPEVFIDRVTSVAFSPDGTLLATGSGSPSRSGQVKLWRLADGSLLREIEEAHSDTVVGLEFSPDGQFLATASTDRFAKVFRVDDGTLATAFEGHTGHVLDVSWRADGLVLATAGADQVVKLWDFEEQRQIKTINGYDQEITSVAFVDHDEKLVTSSGDKSVRLGSDRLDGKEFVYASALSRDGEWLVAGAQDSVVRVWRAKEKKLVQEFGAPVP